MEGASEIFQSKAERKESKPYTEDDLMKKIGRLEIENDFLRSVSTSCGLNPEKLKCGWPRKLDNLIWCKLPVKLTRKGRAFYEKVV